MKLNPDEFPEWGDFVAAQETRRFAILRCVQVCGVVLACVAVPVLIFLVNV